MKINFLHGITLFSLPELDLAYTVQILYATAAMNKAPWGEVNFRRPLWKRKLKSEFALLQTLFFFGSWSLKYWRSVKEKESRWLVFTSSTKTWKLAFSRRSLQWRQRNVQKAWCKCRNAGRHCSRPQDNWLTFCLWSQRAHVLPFSKTYNKWVKDLTVFIPKALMA